MDKFLASIVIVASIAVWLVLSICAPWVLSDDNTFLKGFVNQELLAFLGVIVTITLASGANLHLELNKMEEKVAKPIFSASRRAIGRSCYALIICLISAIILVIIKPLLPARPIAMAFCNGFAIIIVIANVMVLVDLTAMIFSIKPDFDNRD